MSLLQLTANCLRNLTRGVWSKSPEVAAQGSYSISNAVVWLDFETTGLDPNTSHVVVASAFVWPQTGSPYWLDLRSSQAQGIVQVWHDGPLPCPLTLTSCVVLAFNVGFERAYLGPSGYDTTNLWLDVGNLVRRCVELPDGLYKLADIYLELCGQHLDKTQQVSATTGEAHIPTLAAYCRKDVEALLELWGTISQEYWRVCPQDWSLYGQILAGSMQTHLKDWPEWLAKTEAQYLAKQVTVGQALRAKVEEIRQACPSWFKPCPWKKDAKQKWQARLVAEFCPDISALTGGQALDPTNLTKLAAKVRETAQPLLEWVEGQPLDGLGKSAVALLVEACWRTSETQATPLTKTQDGWRVGPNQLLNRNTASVKGHTPFTKDAVIWRPATDTEPARPGIACNLPELQAYLTDTAFWQSIRSRATKLTYQPTKYEGYVRHLPAPQVSGTYTGRSIDPFWLVLSNPKKGRLGSDIKERVQSRPGHKLVRLDFSTQEVRLMLYWNAMVGRDRWGWPNRYANSEYAEAELFGSKAAGTDPHSVFGRKVGLSRDGGKQVSFCVPQDAEALVLGRGWVSRRGLAEGDVILTHNTQTGLNEWQPILALHDFPNEPLIHLHNAKGFSAYTTANHRWFGDKRTDHGNKGRVMQPTWRTTETLGREIRILQAAPSVGQSGAMSGYRSINKYTEDAVWVPLVTQMTIGELWAFYNSAISADGCICPRNHGLPGYGSATFTQNVQKQPGYFEAVQLAGYLLGFNVFSAGPYAGTNKENMMRAKFGANPYRLAHILKRDSVGCAEVWCPETTNGTWVMRQGGLGGTITITGNSLQFGGGVETLVTNSGLAPDKAVEAIQGYRGTRHYVQNWLDEPEMEFVGGMTSGYATMCLHLEPETARTLLNHARPRKTHPRPSQLTLGNFPVQGSGVDLRDRLLAKLYDRTCERLGWCLVMLLHDEQVFEVPEALVDWFCQHLAEAHAEVYRELYLECFGLDECPEQHWRIDGAEVYTTWRKEVGYPENHDNGYLWLPA